MRVRVDARAGGQREVLARAGENQLLLSESELYKKRGRRLGAFSAECNIEFEQISGISKNIVSRDSISD